MGLGAFFGNNLFILVIVHGLWLPFIICLSDWKETILFALNEIMLACLVWDDYLGIVCMMPITIIVGVGYAIIKIFFYD